MGCMGKTTPVKLLYSPKYTANAEHLEVWVSILQQELGIEKSLGANCLKNLYIYTIRRICFSLKAF